MATRCPARYRTTVQLVQYVPRARPGRRQIGQQRRDAASLIEQLTARLEHAEAYESKAGANNGIESAQKNAAGTTDDDQPPTPTARA